MKKIILFAYILFHFSVRAQTTMTCEEKVDKFLIEKIKPYASNDLIPYYSKQVNKWGFFHRKTKKIITKPILNEPYFFHPNLNFHYSLEQMSEDRCTGEISGSLDNYKLKETASSESQLFVTMKEEGEIKPSFKSFVKSDLTGFEVDEEGQLTYFSPHFYDEVEDRPTIFRIFKVKNAYCAIVMYDNHYAVINQRGVPFPNFEKLSDIPTKKQSYSNEDDAWFWMNTGKEEYSFRSLLSGIQLKESFSESPNWTNNTQDIGYAILTIGKQKGLMDLTTMQWKIASAAENDFSSLAYASLEPLNYGEYAYDSQIAIEMIQENRKKAYIYIRNSKNQYLDLNLKLYKPIQ
ncbi:hypothetical protein LZQ00_10770 [Sphingobacterium sp. SRCM116780]|uniref:hypothetical protein n=1 Tax=Sphingobacterium sp. SRCM116780 TaxID=2907623 RepID=UPI001F1D630A|nr:hypothetical protein [Sphingobacterium sp. SRCM116780]UIR54758.1 hypothetical protein LZQ00_10770 [Sphingobacterium sp. SRCM116780]